MGVPKFYRWVSERYPLINQKIGKDTQFLPKFDNMYLDMNGIIHTCTHPNDEDYTNKISMKDMVLGMFSYVDRMVHIVKPQKVLVLAVDGCAPRAKMNQQRSRRFASAKDRREGLEKALREGTMTEEEARSQFDSNCITPGTEFMEEVSHHFQYFIRQKIKEDPLWRKLKVIYSGHDVPGEGEHKIMDYIRHVRMQPGYDPNTRHCLCGLDADLIMLGLASHEPHFSLLREEVDFTGGRGGKKGGSTTTKEVKKQVEQDKWELLHLSALRQYLDLEFGSISLPFGYDLERIIDDWVLLVMLVGNDFLPHLPTMSIAEGGLDDLMDQYKKLLPGLGGYITEGAQVNFERLATMLATIGRNEEEVFEKRRKLLEKERKRKGKLEISAQLLAQTFVSPSDDTLDDDNEETIAKAQVLEGAPYAQFAREKGLITSDSTAKRKYYAEKFGILETDREVVDRLVRSYVEGIQWCFQYYYQGVQSWTWFFPFHYAPLASDMVDLTRFKINLVKGSPFKPFMQLLSCLPSDSAGFLPQCYRELMTFSTSPLAEFYPRDFRVDMDGKRNAWEGVNLLPFIDEKKLVDAVKTHCPDEKLSPEERARNEFGHDLIFQFDPSITHTVPSTFPAAGLPDLEVCQSSAKRYLLPPMDQFVPNLLKGTVADGRYPGDPQLIHALTLRSDIPGELKSIGVTVFNRASQKDTLVLNVRLPVFEDKAVSAKLAEAASSGEGYAGVLAEALQEMQKKRNGRLTVFVDFPNLREAQVMAVADDDCVYELLEEKRKKFVFHKKNQSKADAQAFYEMAENAETRSLLGSKTVGTGGMKIGEVEALIKIRPILRMEIDIATGASKQIYSDVETWVPVQLVCFNNTAPDPRFIPQKPKTAEERFPLTSKIMCLQKVGYGLVGTVVGFDGENTVQAEFNKMSPQIPPFGHTIANSIVDQYINSHKAARLFGIDPGTLGKVSGSILLRPGRYDIGLNLKVGRTYIIPGYVRARTTESTKPVWSDGEVITVVSGLDPVERIDDNGNDLNNATNINSNAASGGWEFTSRALELIAAYKKKFPEVFQAIVSKPNSVEYDIKDVFGSGEEGKKRLDQVCKWLEQIDTFRLPLVPITSKTMSRDAILAVQRASDDVRKSILSSQTKQQTVVVKLSADVIYKYGSDIESDWLRSPTTKSPPRLGDRVVNMGSPVVPFGLGGTVVATHASTGCVEVVFDKEFVGGTSLYGACGNNRGKLLPWYQLLNLSRKNYLVPRKQGGAQKQHHDQPQQAQSSSSMSQDKKATKLKSKKGMEKEAAAQMKSPKQSKQGSKFVVPPVSQTSSPDKENTTKQHELDKQFEALLQLQPGPAKESRPTATATATSTAGTEDDLASFWLELQSQQRAHKKRGTKKKTSAASAVLEEEMKKEPSSKKQQNNKKKGPKKDDLVPPPPPSKPELVPPPPAAPQQQTQPQPELIPPVQPEQPPQPPKKSDPLDELFMRAAKATGKEYKQPAQQPQQQQYMVPPQMMMQPPPYGGYYPPPPYGMPYAAPPPNAFPPLQQQQQQQQQGEQQEKQ